MRNPDLSLGIALKRRPQLVRLRATFDSIDPRIFADNKQLQKIDNSNWQVIFGRRGAGKTTLLATYGKYVTDTRTLEQNASIEVNVTDFISLVASSTAAKVPDIEKAQIYFSDFMRYLCQHLFNVFTEADTRSKFVRLSELYQKKNHVQELVVQLHNSTLERVPSAIGGKRRAKQTRNKQTSQTHGSGANIGIKVGLDVTKPPGASMNAGALWKAASSNTGSEVLSDVTDMQNYKFAYGDTRAILEEILKVLRIKKMFIIIDEWSELDRSANGKIQPHFAELLKRVFWNKDRFVVKIGAVRNQTKLNTSSRSTGLIGLELSADIFEINLDEVYSSQELNKVRFYEDLLFRHLSYCNPDLLDFKDRSEVDLYGTPYLKPIDTFISYIFKSREELAFLISGAGGLPRDFLEIFDIIAEARNFSVTPRWSMKDVKHGIRDHFLKRKLINFDEKDEHYELYKKVIKLVKQNRSRLLVVPKIGDRDQLYAVADFYHKRLLHDVALHDVPPLLRPKFNLYYADLGLQLDASRDKLDDIQDVEKCPLNGTESEEDVKRFLLV